MSKRRRKVLLPIIEKFEKDLPYEPMEVPPGSNEMPVLSIFAAELRELWAKRDGYVEIECPWHDRVVGRELYPGVYKCPECIARQQKITSARDGDEVDTDRPEKAAVLKRERVGTLMMSMHPSKRAVIHWEACEDVHAGDTMVNVPVRDARHGDDMTIRKACRPFRNPMKDIPRLFGVALEDVVKGDDVPVHVLAFRHDEEGDDPKDWIELTNCELVTEV